MSVPSSETKAASRARRGRNVVIAVALALFVVLIFVVTLIRLRANVTHDPDKLESTTRDPNISLAFIELPALPRRS